MEQKTSFRARVMKYAWQIFRTTGEAWRICVIRAWQLYRLAKAMRDGIVAFYYSKADGSVRKAIGTLADLQPGATAGTKRAPSFMTFAYFDVERRAFRCFKVENFICCTTL